LIRSGDFLVGAIVLIIIIGILGRVIGGICQNSK
jgi:hypothetical protein